MAEPRRILIVDPDAELCQALAEQLGRGGEFAVVEAATALAGIASAKNGPFDVALVDTSLPGGDAVRDMRAVGAASAFLLLGGPPSPDSVEKPIRLNLLLARLRALLRPRDEGNDMVLPVGPYSFRPAARVMLRREPARSIRLTEKEAAILQYLYRAGQRAVDRATLLNEVWGYNAGVTTRTLETHIWRLRQKIERDPAHAELLVTEEGGYRLLP